MTRSSHYLAIDARADHHLAPWTPLPTDLRSAVHAQWRRRKSQLRSFGRHPVDSSSLVGLFWADQGLCADFAYLDCHISSHHRSQYSSLVLTSFVLLVHPQLTVSMDQ